MENFFGYPGIKDIRVRRRPNIDFPHGMGLRVDCEEPVDLIKLTHDRAELIDYLMERFGVLDFSQAQKIESEDAHETADYFYVSHIDGHRLAILQNCDPDVPRMYPTFHTAARPFWWSTLRAYKKGLIPKTLDREDKEILFDFGRFAQVWENAMHWWVVYPERGKARRFFREQLEGLADSTIVHPWDEEPHSASMWMDMYRVGRRVRLLHGTLPSEEQIRGEASKGGKVQAWLEGRDRPSTCIGFYAFMRTQFAQSSL